MNSYVICMVCNGNALSPSHDMLNCTLLNVHSLIKSIKDSGQWNDEWEKKFKDMLDPLADKLLKRSAEILGKD